ncbi:MAG TPA: type II toxin-antitoxin system RelE/ParE family toxin [Solirubrobacteraceae bacterium]|nr:type II toxin-antitoxin system RelE/ParE family toxin [Solirubrobacteraceae bacterium]
MADPLSNIELAPRAIRDLKHLDHKTRKRVQRAFEALGTDAANLDIKPVSGHAPWRRLRVGEHRVLYRELTDAANARYLVARVIDRRDLHRAVDKL